MALIRVQRKSVLQLVIQANCSQQVLAQKSFQLARKIFLQFFYNLNSPPKPHLPIGQVKNRNHQLGSEIHQPRAIGHHFLCTLLMKSEVCSNQDNLLLVVIFLYFYDLIIICSVTVILLSIFKFQVSGRNPMFLQ